MANVTKGRISKIAGPVVVASGMKGSKMYDVVRVGKEELLGEIIQLRHDKAIIQVYEDTTGVRPKEPVYSTQKPLTIELGPGLIANIYDGIARPLADISKQSGDFIARGIALPALDRKKVWEFNPIVKKGQKVEQGQVLGTVKESEIIEHRILVPVGVRGEITNIKSGKMTVMDTAVTIKTKKGSKTVNLYQEWPVRMPRPFQKKLVPITPLVTGQRVFDTFFPVAKGGTAAIPGPFGSGKTVTQHSLAKWSDADVIVYVGCGERGNEMTEVLSDFPKLIDPKSGKPLMERTVLIANTSNMPVAAREASVYTGVTIAEYFRDMGYDSALMADSTSRWAEAMREIGARLEEMPGEEGYPAYLASRLAQFYERAGPVVTLNEKQGSVSIIGAVSPPGGDFSEPVTQNTLRMTKVFWALDAPLAYRRHFPAINWLTSYSLYTDELQKYFAKEVSKEYPVLRREAMALLQKEAELQEIVQLVGPDALPEEEKLVLFTSKSLKEDFLQQNAYHDVDAFCSLEKQYLMLKTIMGYYERAKEAIDRGVRVGKISSLKVNETVARMKENKDIDKNSKDILAEIEKELSKMEKESTMSMGVAKE
ncbi:V-type ATP synthase subunit A [bacterium]|nr:V-type ATP synthase subunit A [bacterium]|tara:strand:- start:1828 stop:3612 length:1785 start_codon:yes stop_codon:yes gene_type:complete